MLMVVVMVMLWNGAVISNEGHLRQVHVPAQLPLLLLHLLHLRGEALMLSFDHPLAEGQEKSEFEKQIQGFFLEFGQGVVIFFF